MSRLSYKQGLLAGATTLALVGTAFAYELPTRAQEAQSQYRPTTTQHQPATAVTEDRQQSAQAQERREAAQARLSAAKLKVCQRRQKVITNIMAGLTTRAEKQLGVFTKISERTQAFYAKQGKTLSNYSELVADANAKKAAAQAAADELRFSSTFFKCDGNDPKGAAQAFKDSLHHVNAALKDYKVAVKNLIVGVKSVQGTTTSSRNDQGGSE